MTSSSGTRRRRSSYRLNCLMSASSRDRLRISWLMVCRRVSSALVTVGRTIDSGTCCRSTRIVAVDRYMLGMNTIRLAAVTNGTAKTTTASHLRRPHADFTVSVAEPLRTASSCIGVPIRVDPLWNEYDVVGLEIEVFVLTARAHDLVVVERDSGHRFAVGPQDDDSRAIGELVEAAGLREDVEHGRHAFQLVPRGAGHLAH